MSRVRVRVRARAGVRVSAASQACASSWLTGGAKLSGSGERYLSGIERGDERGDRQRGGELAQPGQG